MALILRKELPRPETGFSYVDRNARSIRKAHDFPLLKDPTIPFDIGGGSRASALNSASKPEYDLEAIHNGYMADSYLHRGVNEFFNKVLKEGYHLESKNPKALSYIQQRFDIMTIAMGDCWQLHFWEFIHDYIKFGNAFLVKGRWKGTNPVPGIRLVSLHGKKPIGGYFAANPLLMNPLIDKSGKITGWEHKAATSKKAKIFKFDDVIHIRHNRQSGRIWGVSHLLPVLDDIRALRHSEEMIIQLIFKSLNPLIHHEVPDTTNTGTGKQADVDAAARAHNVSAVNGYIVTPPGHKLQILGVENKALRAEGYLKALKARVFAGLGLSEVVMGEASTSSAGTTESFASVMFDQVRLYQRELEFYINFFIIHELLLEGGYDPLSNPNDTVTWKFDDVDRDRKIKLEEHALLQYTGNAITLDELRDRLGLQSLTPEEVENLYLYKVQIPLASIRSGTPEDTDTGQKGPSSPQPAKSTLKNKVKPKNQHSSLILGEYAKLSVALAQYVRRTLEANKPLRLEEAYTISTDHLQHLEQTAGKQNDELLSIFCNTTKTAIHLASNADTIASAIASVHGVFAGSNYKIELEAL